MLPRRAGGRGLAGSDLAGRERGGAARRAPPSVILAAGTGSERGTPGGQRGHASSAARAITLPAHRVRLSSPKTARTASGRRARSSLQRWPPPCCRTAAPVPRGRRERGTRPGAAAVTAARPTRTSSAAQTRFAADGAARAGHRPSPGSLAARSACLALAGSPDEPHGAAGPEFRAHDGKRADSLTYPRNQSCYVSAIAPAVALKHLSSRLPPMFDEGGHRIRSGPPSLGRRAALHAPVAETP